MGADDEQLSAVATAGSMSCLWCDLYPAYDDLAISREACTSSVLRSQLLLAWPWLPSCAAATVAATHLLLEALQPPVQLRVVLMNGLLHCNVIIDDEDVLQIRKLCIAAEQQMVLQRCCTNEAARCCLSCTAHQLGPSPSQPRARTSRSRSAGQRREKHDGCTGVVTAAGAQRQPERAGRDGGGSRFDPLSATVGHSRNVHHEKLMRESGGAGRAHRGDGPGRASPPPSYPLSTP